MSDIVERAAEVIWPHVVSPRLADRCALALHDAGLLAEMPSNDTGVVPADGAQRHETGARTTWRPTGGYGEGRVDSEPAERRTRDRWLVREVHRGWWWEAVSPLCRGALAATPARHHSPCGCLDTNTYDEAIDHVRQQLRDRAIEAIENGEVCS